MKEVRTSLTGVYQLNNAALALSALSCVMKDFKRITKASILEGMKTTQWPGRLEIVSRNPVIVPDMQRCLKAEDLLSACKNFAWRTEPRAFKSPLKAVEAAINSNRSNYHLRKSLSDRLDKEEITEISGEMI